MSTDLFDHLAEDDVPEPPDEFDQEFRTRLNRTLLTIQTFEIIIIYGAAEVRHVPSISFHDTKTCT